ncbi:flagellar basal-body MS-ring/collar protein FliF [Thioalkalivibrio sp.]|uniref:flagellar basal-body MS-ring/collar protein FliF n=1 Tax=Thioalkalivibrio sp. TaxID=2093813 RepID=UPI003563FF48
MASSLAVINDQFRGLVSLPLERQIGLIVALAAALTLVVSLVLWLTRPNYVVLFPNLPEQESAQVLEALEQSGVPFRLDPVSGAVQVPAAQLHEARLKLATEGLPKASGFGFELLEKDQGLGTSRLIEDARYHRAIEGELARSIATLNSVESARVHLALPRQSVFVRERSQPTASVLVNLYAGRSLDEGRAAGIVHLVSSSIPDLNPENVTVVDQRGRLLTQPHSHMDGLAGSGRQLDFTRRLEEGYVRRIMDIISPIVGSDAIRAQVAAEVDFSRVERTTEAYDPERSAVRSEQISEDERRDRGMAGVPGALSNQPPETGVIGEAGEAGVQQDQPGSVSRRSVRNFELDRTVSHIREAPGGVQRLSVAVVVDHQERPNAEGVLERGPLSDDEMARITTLVREAVGFDAERGDSVNVINASFRPVETPEPLPEAPLWQEPWVMDLTKTVLAVIMVVVLALTVVRPLLRSLAERGVASRQEGEDLARLALTDEGAGAVGTAEAPGVGQEAHKALAGPQAAQRSYDNNLEAARNIVREDPRRVAQLMKNWMASDGGAV